MDVPGDELLGRRKSRKSLNHCHFGVGLRLGQGAFEWDLALRRAAPARSASARGAGGGIPMGETAEVKAVQDWLANPGLVAVPRSGLNPRQLKVQLEPQLQIELDQARAR